MTTLADTAPPRKRVATYGKAVRKRIPDYKFTSLPPGPHTPEAEETGSVAPIPPTMPAVEPAKLKQVPKKSISRSPSSSPASGNVYDVPSSDDETAQPTSRPTQKTNLKPAKKTKPTATSKKAPPTTIGDDERRKRVKLSPASHPPQKLPPVKANVGKQSTIGAAPKQVHPSIGTRHTSTMAARPKPPAVKRKPESPNIPRETPATPKRASPSTPSRTQSDTDTMDVDSPAAYISPRGLQIWKGLLGPLEDDEENTMLEPGSRRAGVPKDSPSREIPSSRKLLGNVGISKNSQKPPAKLPRRRLIDSLVEQTPQEDDMVEDISGSDESDVIPMLSLSLKSSSMTDLSRSGSLAPELPHEPTALPSSQGSQNTGLKFTYSRQRSMLSEQDPMKELLDMPSQSTHTPGGRRIGKSAIPALQSLQSFPEEEGNSEGAVGIRSVHELRQAGANNRFMDEIEDLLDRIGTPTTPPSSMRRSGLLDLASKMADKDFVRKFRANGVEQRLFIHLGQEMDLIAGTVLVSILVAVLVDSNMPHIVAQLRRHGIAKLLIRLLEGRTGIVPLSKERKNNMSKIAQSSVLEHQNFMLKLPVWEELQPHIITPRTTALKCLELMIRQTREAGNSSDIISKELTTTLFSTLKSAHEESSWELPSGQSAIDFCLALSALESHSITTRSAYDESIWIGNYLPIIADTLETALSRPVDGFGILQVLILRLTLNVTNNSSKASDVFAKGSLVAVMGQAIVAKFKLMSRFLREDEFAVTVDHLILILGVMINFAEWGTLSRECLQDLNGQANDPLPGMVKLFVDNQASMSEAESVEESQKNVAFGYLSVALGYLALLPVIRERIRLQLPQKNIRPLIASIEEFIGHHKAVDNLIEADEDGHNAHTGLTERLESLVKKLCDVRLHGV